MKIEVLVATMYQENEDLLERLNLQSDAVVVNQCDRSGYREINYRGYTVKWIDTVQRGLSKSRNMALSYATGDICLLADDDIRYVDGYPQFVVAAFRECPADIIAFNTHMENSSGAALRKHTMVNGKASSFSYYGSVRLAFKRKSIQKYAIYFNELFGAGSVYCSGEESLFLRECRKKKLSVYVNKAFLAHVDYSVSSWFNGYNEKYYIDKGAFLAAAYGRLVHIYKWYFLLQSRKISSLSLSVVNQCIKKGIHVFRQT